MKKFIIASLFALVVITGWGLVNHTSNEKANKEINEPSELKVAGILPWHDTAISSNSL